LLWLLIPLAGLLIGIAWVAWRTRPKRTPDAVEGMAEMYRIRQAMNQPMPEKLRQRPQVQVEATNPLDVRTESSTPAPAARPALDATAGAKPAIDKPSDASFRKTA
jgi:hypothetical protein